MIDFIQKPKGMYMQLDINYAGGVCETSYKYWKNGEYVKNVLHGGEIELVDRLWFHVKSVL
jgi:hypothetical protein